MAYTRLRVAGLILAFIVSLLALERLCSANSHAQLASGRKGNQAAKANNGAEKDAAANCDEFGYGRKALGGGNGCNGFRQKPGETKTLGKSVPSKAESQAFLEATLQVYQLMRRDYGFHGRPRSKPPINNHEPKD